MDNFIYELLTNNKSVILPEFGSLSYIDEAKGTVMFNPYIKFNDGKLEKFLCEKHGLDKQDAVNRIAKFVKDLELKVNTGEPYSIFQVGRFVKTTHGDIDFESWGTYESVSAPPAADIQSKPEDIKEITEKEEPQQESTLQEKEVTETISEKILPVTETEKLVKKEVITEEEVESIKPVYEKPADRTLSSEETKQTQNKFVPSQTETIHENLISEGEKSNKSTYELTDNEPKQPAKLSKKRGVGIYVLAIVLLIIGGTVTYVGFNLDQVKQWIGLTSGAQEEEQNVVNSDENKESVDSNEDKENLTPANEDLVEEVESSETPASVPSPSPQPVSPPVSEGNFHIIVGSFGNPDNANNLANSLKSKGYPSQVIGPVNDMHMVSFGAYPSREAAQAQLGKATEETGGGWIMKR
jgi:cell division septation protein DedD